MFDWYVTLLNALVPETRANPNRWVVRALLGALIGWSLLALAFLLGAAMKGNLTGERTLQWTLLWLGGCLCAGGLLLSWIWPPSPGGTQSSGTNVLWVRPWRRALFAAAGTLPLWALAVRDWLRSGEPNPLTAIVLGIALAAGWTMGRERVRYSEVCIERVGGIGPKQSVRWDEVVALEAAYTGVSLITGPGRWVGVAGCMLEGWPEFAATALERLPLAAFENSPGAREKLEMIALRFTSREE